MNAPDTSIPHRIAFASLRGITSALADQILARIGSEEAFFAATERQLSAMMGFSNKIFGADYRNALLEKAEHESHFIDDKGISPLYYSDDNYPARLRECPDAPLMLYTLGKCDLNDAITIAIVGTRHATPYGLEFTADLVNSLAAQVDHPVIIVSGLAFGIDIAAHRAAIRAGLPTVAVLAHGLNTIYPASHRSTASEIARGCGMLVTDYTTSAPVTKHNFLARNRIVAGLCDCTMIVESAEKGGAMATARIASEYGRDVFALPGRIADPYSAGCNTLIARNVAALVTSPADIIDSMRWQRKPTEATQQSLFPELSEEETAVMDYLYEHGEARLNSLSIALNINIGRLTGLMIELEFKHLVTPFPGALYRPSRI